jgi:hypothetical protein
VSVLSLLGITPCLRLCVHLCLCANTEAYLAKRALSCTDVYSASVWLSQFQRVTTSLADIIDVDVLCSNPSHRRLILLTNGATALMEITEGLYILSTKLVVLLRHNATPVILAHVPHCFIIARLHYPYAYATHRFQRAEVMEVFAWQISTI